jgi:hypothetical protein
MEQELLEGLKQAVMALNQIPRFRLYGSAKDSYELLSELDKLIRKAEGQCPTMSPPSTS